MKDKIVIYQVLPRLFGNRNETLIESGTIAENGCGKFSAFDDKTLKELHDMGITHVWYTGVIRHATQTDYSAYGIPKQHPEIVKGKAGSPYAITDYYDVDPDLADKVSERMAEWEQLIERTHVAGMKVVLDFVPNHVAREYRSVCKPTGVRDLGEDDDTALHFSPRNDFYYCWGESLDLGAIASGTSYEEMPAKATGNADMAEMVPVEFWNYATNKVRKRFPHILFIGEVYNTSLYRTYIANGFDYLYDKVGMYDCMRGVISGMRGAHEITREWQATDDIHEHMLYFLENHDEQRIASDFFASAGRKAIPAAAIAILLRTNPFMLYSGQEFGEKGMDCEGFSGRDGRTSIFDYRSQRCGALLQTSSCCPTKKRYWSRRIGDSCG